MAKLLECAFNLQRSLLWPMKFAPLFEPIRYKLKPIVTWSLAFILLHKKVCLLLLLAIIRYFCSFLSSEYEIQSKNAVIESYYNDLLITLKKVNVG